MQRITSVDTEEKRLRIFAFRRESGRFLGKRLPGEPDVEREVVALEVVSRAKENLAAGRSVFASSDVKIFARTD